jgi:hypothetical protein
MFKPVVTPTTSPCLSQGGKYSLDALQSPIHFLSRDHQRRRKPEDVFVCLLA